MAPMGSANRGAFLVHNYTVRQITSNKRDGWVVLRPETSAFKKILGVASTREIAIEIARDLHATWLEHGSRKSWQGKPAKAGKFITNAQRADAWARSKELGDAQ